MASKYGKNTPFHPTGYCPTGPLPKNDNDLSAVLQKFKANAAIVEWKESQQLQARFWHLRGAYERHLS